MRRLASRLTIRARITGGSLLIAILISVAAGVIVYTQVERIVGDGQVRVLESIEGPYLTALAESGSTSSGAEEVDPPGPDQLVAVIAPDGSSQVDTLPPVLSTQLDALAADAGTTRTVASSGGTYLVRVTAVDTDAGMWTIVTAARDDLAAEIRGQVAFLLVASIAVINLAFGAASWFIGTAALRPVGQLRRSAARLVTESADELLPVGPAEDEIAELATTLNQLIAQLRDSADRERQIVSDASHELRTPLAIMQTQLELAQAQSTSLDAMKDDVAAVQRTLARLSGMATSLLELSRIDAQVAPGSASARELVDELADAADRGRLRVGGRDIRIDFADDVGHGAVRVRVGAADFGRVVDNLVSNALAALGDRGTVDLALAQRPDALVLRVGDDAGGMDPAFVAHALARFSRADAARTRGGAGLGLPIVAGIASVAGGSVELRNDPGVGLVVEVTFPVGGGVDAGADAGAGRPGGS